MSKKKILFISKGSDSPSTRYRAFSFFPLFQQNGWEPEHFTASSHPADCLKLLSLAAKADIVVVLRKTFRWPFTKLLRIVSKKLIFDLDDAIFCNDDGSHSRKREQRFTQIATACDQVWAGNHYLAEQAKQRGAKNTFVLPTVIDPQKYLLHPEKPQQYFDLVWIGSSATRKYLEQILATLDEAAKHIPQLRLKIIADFSLTTQYLKILPIQWRSQTEAQELASAHVGIAPMIDDHWTKGKCALKVIQYMGAGLPVISSPVGLNKELVISGQTGFIASTPQEWLTMIMRLKNDVTLRQQLGIAGRQHVTEHFSIAANFKKICATLNDSKSKIT